MDIQAIKVSDSTGSLLTRTTAFACFFLTTLLLLASLANSQKAVAIGLEPGKLQIGFLGADASQR